MTKDRIRELALKASGGSHYLHTHGEPVQNFAKLIIEECTKFIEDRSDHDNFVAKVAPLMGKR